MKFQLMVLLHIFVAAHSQQFTVPSPDLRPVVEKSVGNLPNYNLGWQWLLANVQIQNRQTGAVASAGLQLSFIRFALLPFDESSQMFMGQAALSMKAEGEPGAYVDHTTPFLNSSQVDYTTAPMRTIFRLPQNGTWTLESSNGVPGDIGTIYEATGSFNEVRFKLRLIDRQGTLWEGRDGYLDAGPVQAQSYYYFAFPDLALLNGVLQVGDDAYDLVPENSSARLGFQYQTREALSYWGWDWFPIRITELDGRRLDRPVCVDVAHKRSSNQTDSWLPEYSHGAWLRDDGKSIPLNASSDYQFTFGPLVDGYPNEVHIDIAPLNLSVTVTPFLAGGLMKGPMPYMEMASSVNGTMNGRPVKGVAYAEHAGYGQHNGDWYQVILNLKREFDRVWTKR